ncbi:MAG TPA: ABC transporter permease [Bdellovibrionales bacterium]|nr:ABC transporter permease [Bdellovibrionales bacterium]
MTHVGRYLFAIIDEFGVSVMFLKELLHTAIYRPCSPHYVFEQIWKVTIQSLGTVAMAGFFVGAILVVQFTVQISEFGALGYLGGLTTSSTVREVGPLLIAFMLAGKIGAYTAAELGTMRVTEQIDAIRCLGADPLQEIILPRFLGIVISSFFLLAVGLFMSISGGVALGYFFSGISPEEYLRHIPTFLTWPSVLGGLYKCLIFAVTLATICTYKGYNTTGGARGVGRAVVSTAIVTMIGIVTTDWFTTLTIETVTNLVLGMMS